MFRNIKNTCGHDDICQNGVAASIVSRLEAAFITVNDDERNRRVKNILAEAKYRRISVPALRALIAGRKRLRLARAQIEKLSPHVRADLAALAVACGETSDLFQFEPVTQSADLEMLLAKS